MSGPQWRVSLETYAYPIIGQLPVSEVMPGHVVAIFGGPLGRFGLPYHLPTVIG